jgi:hypothetical protein
MAIVHEELKHEYLPASIMVSQRQAGETIAPWAILHCEVDGMERMSPKELRELGRWMVQEGKRLGRQYKSNGEPRKDAA